MILNRALITATSIAALCISSSYADRSVTSSKSYDIAIGGTLEAQIGSRYQNTKFLPQISPNNKYIGFDTSASMHGSVKLFNENGWIYGAQLGLKMGTVSNDAAGSDYLDRTYMYIDNPKIMRVEVGTNRSAANAMKLSASTIAVATGGVGGAWTKFASIDSFSADFKTKEVDGDNFIKSPKLVLKEGELEDGSSHERYRKITVYVPIQDFKLGFSYGPDGANLGGRAFIPYKAGTTEESIRSKNPISGGLSWKKSLNKEDELSFSIVGEYAKYNPKSDGKQFNDYAAVMAGGVYKLGKISFAGSYGNHFKSKQSKEDSSVKNAYVFSAGAAYDFDKAATSISYLYSDQNTNVLHAVSTGVNYSLKENFVSYLELTYFNADQKKPTSARNSGATLILGARVTF